MRSLQFLKSLGQWNGKDLTVSGGSQGGVQMLTPSNFSLSSISWK
jgi:cephalosporin-C deacetylase-like acetyl esterase